MSFVLYAAVLTVSVTSVLLGLDWLASPPPAPVKHVQVARTTAPIIAPAKVAVKPAAKPVVAQTPATVATPAAPETKSLPQPQAAPSAPATVASVAPAASSTTAQGDDQSTAQSAQGEIAAAVPPAPRCDVQACSRAYVSFNAADCTWQPYEGPRRFCDKGTPPPAASVAGGDAVAQTPTAAPSQAQARAPSCNVQACSRAYLSFDASDCTWQPYEGPRQLCEK